MNSKLTPLVAAIVVVAATLLPIRIQGHSEMSVHHHYKLIALGNFGGPNAGVNGPNVPIISSNGTYGGEAETPTPDPYAPNFCQDGDCLVQHAQKWRDGILTDLGTLPGVDLSSGATWVSDNATIVGSSENGLIDPLLGVPEIRAVLWTEEGQIIDLGTLEGGYESFATADNDSKQVAGFFTQYDSRSLLH